MLVEAQRGNADLMRALRSVPDLSMFTRAVEDHYQMIDDVKNKTILAPNNAAYRSRLSQAAVFDGISRYLDGNQYTFVSPRSGLYIYEIDGWTGISHTARCLANVGSRASHFNRSRFSV